MQWIYIILYLCLALLIIFAVGTHLFRHGAPFLKALFPNDQLDIFINRLLLTGYYLINIGYAVFNLVQNQILDRSSQLINLLAHNIGVLCLILGTIHVLNLIVLYNLSKSSINHQKQES